MGDLIFKVGEITMIKPTKIILILSTFAALLLFAGLSGAGKQKQQKYNKTQYQPKYLPDKIVVKFKSQHSIPKSGSTTGIESVDSQLSQFGVTEIEPVLKSSTQKKSINGRASIENIYNIKLNGEIDPKVAAQMLSQDTNVEYAEVKWMHKFAAIPNDPQYYLMTQFPHVQAPAAWDIVKGEQGSVIISITDSGTDWDHEDLVENIWNNLGEDADGDGHTIEHNGSTWEFDSGDINSIDDDGNGYIDDFIGWNFPAASYDPTSFTGFYHGTAMAGIAATRTNNSTGISSISWNCQLMPIDISHKTMDDLECTAYAYESIIYATENGADIVSCSWGRPGPFSQFGQDVIDFAYNNGTLIVVAALNGHPDFIGDDIDIYPIYPANYKHVLAVGATQRSNDIKSNYSNYGVTVDVFAPADGIRTTDINNQYTTLQIGGTSAATPMTAGLAGLIKTLNSSFTVDQLREQVRVTCDPIDYLNPVFAGKLGKGRINALRAVTDFTFPAIRIDSVSFVDSGGDSVIDAGETVNLTINFINYLATSTNVDVTLSVEDSNITVVNGSSSLGSMNSNEIKSANFQVQISNKTYTGYVLRFYIDITDGSYIDRDFFRLMVRPPLAIHHNTGMVQTSITNRGNIGYVYAYSSVGVGFVYNGKNYLQQAGLLIATDENHISDCLGGEHFLEEYEHDFKPANGTDFKIISPGQHAWEEGTITLVDSLADNPIGVTVKESTFADYRDEYKNFVIFKYIITNNNQTQITNLHAGLAFDWDIRYDNCDFGRYDATRKMGYVINNTSNPTHLVAVKLLTDNSNVHFNAFEENYYANNGFTNQEKWQFLTGGIQTTSLNNTDIFTQISEGPFDIAAGDSIEVAFAAIGANSQQELQASADSAQAFYDNPPPPPPPFSINTKDQVAKEFRLFQNYPNPFNPSTTIEFAIPRSEFVTLKIYNILGKEVATLVSEKLISGSYNYKWDASGLASGLYFYQLITQNGFLQTRKLVLLR